MPHTPGDIISAIYAVATAPFSATDKLECLANLHNDILSLDQRTLATYDLPNIQTHVDQCKRLISPHPPFDLSPIPANQEESTIHIDLKQNIQYSSLSILELQKHFSLFQLQQTPEGQHSLAKIGPTADIINEVIAKAKPFFQPYSSQTSCETQLNQPKKPLYSTFLFDTHSLFEITARIHQLNYNGNTLKLNTVSQGALSIQIVTTKLFLISLDFIRNHPLAHRLTKAELDIVQKLCTCHTPVAISVARKTSLATVRTQIKAIFEKMQVSSLGQLIALMYSYTKRTQPPQGQKES